MVIKRGEIWWAELPEPSGSEPGYRRPLVIIQSNEFNSSNISTVIAAIITSNIYLASAPGNMLLSAKNSKLSKKVLSMLQIPLAAELNVSKPKYSQYYNSKKLEMGTPH